MSARNLDKRLLPLLTTLVLLVPAFATAAEAPADSTGGIIDTEAGWREVADARDAAGQNRHRQAVAAYLEALASDARLVSAMGHELAYQKLWQENADQAVFYFRRYLARHPEQENREARRGLALACSWSGRQGEAVAQYRELVRQDPADGDARVGLGRTLIWNNQLTEGYAQLRGVEREFPRTEAARRQASGFLLTYLDGYTTPLNLTASASWDSDHLDIWKYSATGAFTVAGDFLLLAMPQVAVYSQPGQDRITAPRLGAGLVGPLAHNWAVHAYAWLDLFRSGAPVAGAAEKLSWNRPGGDLWFTWLPAPHWRVDFGGNSAAVETYPALSRHLHYEQASLSADWRFAPRFSCGVAGNLAGYSDGNTKRRAAANLRWRHEGRLEIHLGPDLTIMDFSQPYPGGYWAPDLVRSAGGTLTLKTRAGRMTFLANGSLATEKETGSDAVTVGGASARIGWRFADGFLAAVEGGYSKSRLTTDSGYNRTFATVSLKGTF